MDVFYSYMSFWRRTMGYEMHEDVMFAMWVIGGKTDVWTQGNYFEHLLDWWTQRENPSWRVLTLFYEDIVENKRACVKLMMDFMGIDMLSESEEDKLIEEVIQKTAHAKMAKEKSKFHTGGLVVPWTAKYNWPPSIFLGWM